MSKHLSPDQFARCAVGRTRRAELQHVSECRECRAELDRFGETLLLFRSAIRQRIDGRAALQAAGAPLLRPVEAAASAWRWALLAAALVVVTVLPFFLNESKWPQRSEQHAATEMNPDAIMEKVNLHLSRTVPAPMEPMMSLIPSDEFINESGGVQ